MRRKGYIVPLVVVAVWIVVAALFATGTLSGAHTIVAPSGPSPACLPATLDHPATLQGTAVAVSPAPETDTASPATQISFLGDPVTEIQHVTVAGSSSGSHEGHLYGYYQGDGGSFVAAKPFAAGERVVVSATIGPPGSERRVSFAFRVATPYPTQGLVAFPNADASPASYQSFASAPQLHPPILDVTSPDGDPGAGDVMMSTGPGPGQYGPLIYTPQGRLVWFDPMAKGVSALDLRVQRYEGQNDLTWWQGRVVLPGFGLGEDIVMDPNYQTVATIRAGNGYQADLHDFQIAPGDVAYLTVYNLMRCDLSSVGGVRNGVIMDTAVQELDIKTGLVRWEWHSLDHVAVGESHVPMPTTATPWDWFHLNSIDPEPGGDILISARSTWAAYQLHAPTGTIQWQLGGQGSSFQAAPGTETAWQHDARMQPGGQVTMFDDGSSPRVHYQSRGVRLALDASRRTVSLVHAYTHPGSPLVADSQGDMQQLADGDVVIGWGAIPSVSEFSPTGALLFDAHMPPGTSSYRVFRFPWNGHPLSPPAVSARVLSTGDDTAVFASWNGDTEVAYWRVLAGPAPGSLTAQATVPNSGFESTITYPNTYPEHKVEYVVAQALGADGRLLATSPAVQVQ